MKNLTNSISYLKIVKVMQVKEKLINSWVYLISNNSKKEDLQMRRAQENSIE